MYSSPDWWFENGFAERKFQESNVGHHKTVSTLSGIMGMKVSIRECTDPSKKSMAGKLGERKA